jgi:hypothetical protein
MNFNSVNLENYIQRDLEKEIDKYLEDREIIAIRGPRQSGKTTLMLKLAAKLKKNYPPEQIVFKTFEDELEKDKFTTNPKEYVKFYLRDKKSLYLFLDEIQYIEKGGKILKLLFDTYPQIKFIVSGSSTLDIVALGRFLVGRVLYFNLLPFSFSEFLRAKNSRLYLEYKEKKFNWQNPAIIKTLHIGKLNQYLYNYLIYGGYPRIALEENKEKKQTLLKNLTTTYLEKDIIRLYGSKYKDSALKVLKYIAATAGSLINYNDISKITSLRYGELKEIFSILQDTYVLAEIAPFHKNLVTELKKNPKYYFLDLGLRNILINRFEFRPAQEGQLLEHYAYRALRSKQPFFWRTTAKAEVDFVVKQPLTPIEVKRTAKVTRSLLSFIKSYNPKIALIANWAEAGLQKRNKTNIYTTPLSLI